MERYRPKTALASAADHLLRLLIAWLAGVGWFVALWGLSLPALTAGTALGGLFWLCARLLGKKRMQKKETALRRTLGGELALEKLLLLSETEAITQCIHWLQSRTNLQITEPMSKGGLGTWDVCPASRDGDHFPAGQRGHPGSHAGENAAALALHHGPAFSSSHACGGNGGAEAAAGGTGRTDPAGRCLLPCHG